MVSFLVWVGAFYAAAVGIYFFWRANTLKQMRQASDYEWDIYIKNEPDFVDHLNRESFFTVFRRTHFPRFPGYALACLGMFFLMLPVIFIILYCGVWIGTGLGLIPKASDIANDLIVRGENIQVISNVPDEALLYFAENLGGFYYFFGVLFSWVLVVTLFTRHYHKNRPGYLRDEIIRAR